MQREHAIVDVEISPDGVTYTFTLRQGPKWSDGKPVTAQDYAWAWQRNVDPKTASPYANTLFPVKNAEAINDGKIEPEQLGVQARDDRTLVVTLEKPAAYFLRLASTWTLMPLIGIRSPGLTGRCVPLLRVCTYVS